MVLSLQASSKFQENLNISISSVDHLMCPIQPLLVISENSFYPPEASVTELKSKLS